MPPMSIEIVLFAVGWLVCRLAFCGGAARGKVHSELAQATGRLVYVGDELLDWADRNIHDLNRARQRISRAVPWRGRRYSHVTLNKV